ncbi:sucrose transporter [Cordyceps fumosorosea ARSEF 2679]|uniref:Sucrose transporter n=1 Tax=Cordyceps fumosorosea (strain ARSEF 2679) TaxID=1081104 RepID=A0A167ZGR9_CORFA|nr:sucrose transporter [Cordyceps fumosorosea ARSEF 2679]OAA67497.1 sucrose transporter [Cordyceps fumosorosea ARSEF 2679]
MSSGSPHPHDAAQPDEPLSEAAQDSGLHVLDPEPEQELETIREDSPLLAASDSDGSNGGSSAGRRQVADPSQATKSVWYLTLLTLSIGGLQIAWSVELSNGSPYLLSLGLSKALMALVWIAGPLTGTLVQPYIGILSDNCRISWGKRKPFMIGSTIGTIFSLLFLSWVKEIIGSILSLFGIQGDSDFAKTTIIIAAVIGIYVLDVAINALQAAIRAFIVDCGPAHQQEAANAMASRLIGVGNILGFIAGYVNLTKPLWFFGHTQFQILCAIACIALTITIVISCAFVHERDPRESGTSAPKNPGVFAFFVTLFKSIKRLPPQIKRVCQVQFCGWVGFFPLLFYSSSYIGEIYVQPHLEKNPHLTPDQLDELYEQATRIGSFALLVNSIVSLLTNVLLPFFIAPTYDSQTAISQPAPAYQERRDQKRTMLDRLHIPGFTLNRAWFGSLVLFAGAMLCTLVVRSVEAATALIGIAGVTWAMTLWAPYAIISAEISRRDVLQRAQKHLPAAREPAELAPLERLPSGEMATVVEDGEEHDEAGVIMGIHNMAIAAPQILANVGSSIIFKIWQKPRGTPGDKSIAFVMAIGGLFVLASAFFVRDLDEKSPSPRSVGDDEEHAVVPHE